VMLNSSETGLSVTSPAPSTPEGELTENPTLQAKQMRRQPHEPFALETSATHA
jgi:hypothetical protein